MISAIDFPSREAIEGGIETSCSSEGKLIQFFAWLWEYKGEKDNEMRIKMSVDKRSNFSLRPPVMSQFRRIPPHDD